MSRPAVLMDLFLPLMLVSSFFLFPTASAQQNCAGLVATDNNRQPFSRCNSLAVLGSSLHWNYDPATGNANIAYRSPLPGASGWVAWGINPTGGGMVGTQALVAVFNDGKLRVIRTQVLDRQPAMQDQDLTFSVTGQSVFRSQEALTIFATIALPNNRTKLTHTWQSSTILVNGVPAGHPTTGPNVLSSGTIDFLSGQSSGGAGNSLLHRKNIHGVLNAVSWGLLMPLGAMIARYLRVFESADPAWFYLHITCQLTAYVLGVSGFGLGLKLGADSKGITHSVHRSIGIVLVCGATLQVLALFLRPDKDHKYRYIWNIYHRGVGFLVIILSVINVLKGFSILKPDNKYKHAYIGAYITLWVIAVTLEVITCAIRRRRNRNPNTYQQQQRDNGMYSAGRQTQMI